LAPNLPDPLACNGAFNVDPDTRTLIVKPASDAPGRAKLLWREGHAKLMEADRTGRLAETVWADGPGQPQVAHGTPGREATLRFKLQPDAYRRLMGTPGLHAVVVVDKRSSRILGVAFRGSR
jgi:hypothetical protein